LGYNLPGHSNLSKPHGINYYILRYTYIYIFNLVNCNKIIIIIIVVVVVVTKLTLFVQIIIIYNGKTITNLQSYKLPKLYASVSNL